MARRTNYSFERWEREKAKATKKAARLKAKKEKAEARRAEIEGTAESGQVTEPGEASEDQPG